jgi:ribosomal subunit interface protein
MSQIKITGIKIEVTEAIQEHVNSHFSKLELHFNDFVISQSVTFSKEGHQFKVHAEVQTANGMFSSTSKGQKFNPMIKDAADKIHKQLEKVKSLPNKDSIRDMNEVSEKDDSLPEDDFDEYQEAS